MTSRRDDASKLDRLITRLFTVTTTTTSPAASELFRFATRTNFPPSTGQGPEG